MDKISLTIDVSKIRRDRIKSRTYKRKDGTEGTAQELKIDVVPLNDPKLIKDGGRWKMWKTHFVIEQQTAEERKAKVESNYIGEGIMFEYTDTQGVTEDDDDANDIPF